MCECLSGLDIALALLGLAIKAFAILGLLLGAYLLYRLVRWMLKNKITGLSIEPRKKSVDADTDTKGGSCVKIAVLSAVLSAVSVVTLLLLARLIYILVG